MPGWWVSGCLGFFELSRSGGAHLTSCILESVPVLDVPGRVKARLRERVVLAAGPIVQKEV